MNEDDRIRMELNSLRLRMDTANLWSETTRLLLKVVEQQLAVAAEKDDIIEQFKRENAVLWEANEDLHKEKGALLAQIGDTYADELMQQIHDMLDVVGVRRDGNAAMRVRTLIKHYEICKKSEGEE